jgi:Phospholipase_D-nuclease N-terminal
MGSVFVLSLPGLQLAAARAMVRRIGWTERRAPLARERGRGGTNAMNIEVGGFFGLLVLIADVWAIVRTVQSGASTGAKVFWIILILLLPVLGFIIWLIAGPR